ncbi:MAG TPA: aldo/keto reductase, partial [Puia sp.]
LDVLTQEGVGCICFSPLAQGMLSDKYLKGIPADSRAMSHRGNGAIDETAVTPERITKAVKLNEIAKRRGQNLAQLALSWVLRHEIVTSVLIGVSKTSQLLDSIKCLSNLSFTKEELNEIEAILRT